MSARSSRKRAAQGRESSCVCEAEARVADRAGGNHLDARPLTVWDLIAALILLCAALASAWLYRFFQCDDAFIAYRYVTNLMQGRGWVYNPGEAVNGASSPLHIMLLTLLSFVTGDVPIAAHLLGAIFLALAAWLWYRVVSAFGRPEGGLAVALVLVTNPFLISTFGMETMLYLGLAMSALYAYHTARVIPGAVLVGLLLLVRADGIVLAAMLLVYHMETKKGLPTLAMAVAAAVAGPWFLFSTLHFGSPYPSTFGARVAQSLAHHGLPFFQGTLFWADLSLSESVWYVLLLPCAALGICALFTRARTLITLPLWALLYFIAYSLLGVPYQHWYYGPPVFALIAVSGLSLLCIERPRSIAKVAAAWAALLVVIALGANVVLQAVQKTCVRLLGEQSGATFGEAARLSSSGIWLPLALGLVASLVAIRVRHHPARARWALAAALFLPLVTAQVRLVALNSRSYPTAQVTAYREVGGWLRHHTPPSSVVAAWEIGAIGYYSERPILDYLGLITPAAQEYVARGDYSWWVRERPPDYVVVRDPPGGVELPGLQEPHFGELYQRLVTLETPGWYPMIIYGRKPAPAPGNTEEDSHHATDAAAPVPSTRSASADATPR